MVNLTAKSILVTAALVLGAAVLVNGQTTFWSDSFDAPAGGTNNNNAGAGWTLNSGGSGSNQWFINTPSGIGCSSSGNVLHVSCSGGFCGLLGGPTEPIYLAAGSNNRSAVSPAISTVGRTNINLTFTFQCQGFANQDYALLAMSSDGGTTWNELPDKYQSVSSCSTVTIAVPSNYEGLADFRIRFRWIESNAAQGVDPPMSVDNITLTASAATCTPPVVDAGTPQTICPGQQANLGGAPSASGGNPSNYVYSWSPAAGLSDPTIANPTVNPFVTTTYTLTVHGGDLTCAVSDQVTITVHTPQTLTVTPSGSTNLCPGQSVTLNTPLGFAGFIWDMPVGIEFNPSITVSAPGNYSVSATDANGCTTFSNTVTVTAITPPPFSIAQTSPIALCPGSGVALNSTAGFSTYLWSTPAGTIVAQNITASVPGNYSVTATSPNGCPVSAGPVQVQSVAVAPISISFSGSLFICPGDSVTLLSSSGFVNYVWSGPGGPYNGQNHEASLPGTYFVTGTDANGCTTNSVQVLVQQISTPALTTNPSGTLNLCAGESIDLSGNNGFIFYSWTTPSGTLTTQSISASLPGTYQLQATTIDGCTRTAAPITIQSVNVPSLNITTPNGTSLCPGQTVGLEADPGFSDYLWTGPSGTYNTAIIDVDVAGTYQLNANYQGCIVPSTSISITAVNVPNLNTTPSGLQQLCPNTLLSANASPGFTNYMWDTPNGSVSGIQADLSDEGSYSLSAEYNGCVVQASPIDVVWISVPQPSTSPSGTVNRCPNQALALNAEAGFSNYSWQTPSGSISGTTINASEDGAYVLQAQYLGCDTQADTVWLQELQLPALSIDANGPLQFCPGQSLTLSASSPDFSNYVWTTPQGLQSGMSIAASAAGTYGLSAVTQSCTVQAVEVELTVVEIPEFVVSPVGPVELCQGQSATLTAPDGFSNYQWQSSTGGVFPVNELVVAESGSYTASASYGTCLVSAPAVQVSVLPELYLDLGAPDTLLCEGGNLVWQAPSGFSNYVWSTGVSSLQLNITTPGSYWLSAQSNSGCPARSDTIHVSLLPLPVANFSYVQLDETDFNVQFTYTGSNANSYAWNFGNNQTSTEMNPVHSFLYDDVWPVQLVVSNGCGSDTLMQMVPVIKTGIAPLSSTEWTIFPNPARGMVKFQSTSNGVFQGSIGIFSSTGQLLQQWSLNGQNALHVDLSQWAPGLYYVQLHNGQGKMEQHKLMVVE